MSLAYTNPARSTLGGIFVAFVNFGLHIWFAVRMTNDHYGDHQPFWVFIVLATIANLLGIVLFIAKGPEMLSAAEGPKAHLTAAESEFSRRLTDQPMDCAMCLLGGTVSNECLCFMTASRAQQQLFRIQPLATALLEDLPFLCLLIHCARARRRHRQDRPPFAPLCPAAAAPQTAARRTPHAARRRHRRRAHHAHRAHSRTRALAPSRTRA